MLRTAIALALVGLAIPAASSAAIPQSAVYDVTLAGDVNGIPFQRTGAMALGPTTTAATTNGINAIEICIGSGSPFIAPELGALWFATNGICVNANGARLDMAFVAVDAAASTVAIRPDPNISATGINGFNQSSGLTANVYQVFEGLIALSFPGNGATVSGTIDILGTGAIFHSEQRYRATLTGTARNLTPAPAADVGEVIAGRGSRTVGRNRTASIATIVCSSGPCSVSAPERVPLEIAGKRYRARVLAPGTVASGDRAPVRVKLARKPFRKLAGRSGKLSFELGISAPNGNLERTLKATLRRPAG